jgi:excinuclease ABC subunit A
LHPADVDKLLRQLDALVDGGNTVIVVEHDMSVIAASDWVVDVGPGAGKDGGRIIACGPPESVAAQDQSTTARDLRRAMPWLLRSAEHHSERAHL